ncbi:GntR family transcriptional regulator [Luteimonas sp. BDR2-5]|uniref:GntR family transcriptional regulator n=1 Tax=Proluteimonas luteida TaxID=2878685 RepID=UPI001E4E5C01|nr:GntR family transcriptional regulator [Luteimonas sp. BDR2-5]MCD9029735.1 GntR family transcriptional regulator [Luteimonas sp. BDR2-5]
MKRRAMRPLAKSDARNKTLGRRGKASPEEGRGAGEPLYRQLVDSLRNDILTGVFPVGSQLPTEEALAECFSVSRHTVREALRQLRLNGLVSSRRGSGTTVLQPAADTPFNVHRVSSIDELIAYASESKFIVDDSAIIDSQAATAMGLPMQSGGWLHLRGFRTRDAAAGPPLCWADVFVAAEYAGVARILRRQRGPVWMLIEEMYGERLLEIEQSLEVRPVPESIAAGLGVAAGESVVEIRRTYRTNTGRIAEIAVNLYPAETFRFSMKLRRA